MAGRRFTLQIFAISFAALLLEIAYTRIVAFKFYYYFTYLVIGFALLGLGAGGVFVAVSRRVRVLDPARLVATCGVLGALTVAVGYWVVATLEIETFRLFESALGLPRLVLLCAALFASFLVIGTAIARILSAAPEAVNRLYGADLAGAALACILAVPFMSWLTPPATVFVAGAALAASAIPLARRDAPALAVGAAVVALGMAGLALDADLLPEPVPDQIKDLNPGKLAERGTQVLYSEWNPVFRVDVMKLRDVEDVLLIAHDGTMGSALERFDGDLAAAAARFADDPRAYPFRVGKPEPEVLVIGAAGGREILASLAFGARHVTGVELNPATISLVRDHFADYTGHLAERDRVTLVNAEGRSYLGGADARYDLIYFVAPDSYTAMNAAASGAFVLSESYLYTQEMIEESLSHLTDGGIICMQFGEFFYERKPNRTARYVATARAALAARGVRDVSQHFLIATNPDFINVSTILVSATPFTPEQVRAFSTTAQEISGARVRHLPGRALDDGPVNRMIDLPASQLEDWFDSHAYNVRPITDDSPFFWHFARFRDAFDRGTDRQGKLLDFEDAVGERVLLILLGVASLFAAVFLLLPFVAIRRSWQALPYKGRTALYFGALGLGFLFFEIVLIQRLVLLLGFPTYSLIVTLFSMLLFSAIGSLVSIRYAKNRRRAVWRLFDVLAVLTVFHAFGLPSLVEALIGTPLALRVVVVVLVIAPLGLCLGAFMPMGIRAVAAISPQAEVTVAWAWAVNGFFSVISSVLTTVLSMAWGFSVVLFLGLAVYAVAAAVLQSLPEPAGAPEPG